MDKKIKAIRPQIIVTDPVERPYYQILYYDTSDKTWHIGYSSYNLANVVKWKQECFEVVGEIEDMEEVKHGHWIVPSGAIKIFQDKYVICSECNVMIPVIKEIDRCWYCPKCGAKMDGKEDNK